MILLLNMEAQLGKRGRGRAISLPFSPYCLIHDDIVELTYFH